MGSPDESQVKAGAPDSADTTATDGLSDEPTTDDSSSSVTSSPDAATDTDATDAPAPRAVSFDTPTGTTLQGTRYGTGSCGVVLVPQVNLDRASWEPQASKLAERGFLALAIDEGEQKTAGVVGAVQYLRAEHDVDDVVLVGASTGGEAVVAAATKLSDAPAGLVTLSAAGGVKHAAELTGRKLFVVGDGDEDRFVETARQLSVDASEPKELLVYESSTHGQRFFESSVGSDLFDRIVALTSAACS